MLFTATSTPAATSPSSSRLSPEDQAKEARKAAIQSDLDSLRERVRSVELLSDHGQARDCALVAHTARAAFERVVLDIFAQPAAQGLDTNENVQQQAPELYLAWTTLKERLQALDALQEAQSKEAGHKKVAAAEAVGAALSAAFCELEDRWIAHRRTHLDTAKDQRRRKLALLGAVGIVCLGILGLAWYFMVTIPNSRIIGRTNLMEERFPPRIAMANLDAIEGSADGTWRWGMGPETVLTIDLSKDQYLALDYMFVNKVDGQNMVVTINGTPMVRYNDIPKEFMAMETIRLFARKGVSHIAFKYDKWNKPPDGFAPDDTRPLAGLFVKLALREDRSKAPAFRNFLTANHPVNATDDLGAIQYLADGSSWRWVYGPKAEFPLRVNTGEEMQLTWKLSTPLPNQGMRILLDGKELGSKSGMPQGDGFEGGATFVSDTATPVLTLEFDTWNKPGSHFAPNDPRPMAAILHSMVVAPAKLAEQAANATAPAQ